MQQELTLLLMTLSQCIRRKVLLKVPIAVVEAQPYSIGIVLFTEAYHITAFAVCPRSTILHHTRGIFSGGAAMLLGRS